MSQSGRHFLRCCPQIVSKFFDSGTTKVPIAVVDFEYGESRFEDDGMRDHRIVRRICVLCDFEILLNYAGRIGQKRPMRTDARTVLICRSQVVRANCDEAAITDLHLAMKVDESLRLSAIFWAVASSAKQ